VLDRLVAEIAHTRGAVAAENAIQGNLALVQRHDVRHTNLLVSADYLKLRASLVAALRPFPAAGRLQLQALELDAAREITDAAKPASLVIEH
jgi:hypothetical protein